MNDERLVYGLATYLRATYESFEQWEKLASTLHGAVAPEIMDVARTFLVEADEPLDQDVSVVDSTAPALPAGPPINLSVYEALDEYPPQFGSIWTTKLTDLWKEEGLRIVPPSVVILAPPPEISPIATDLAQVAPISDWTLFAAENDLILPESSGHGQIMVQLWSEQPIQRAQLHKVIGVLSPTEMEWLTSLWLARRGGQAATAVPDHVLGPPLQGATDIRMLFREIEWLRGQLLSAPVRQTFASDDESTESAPRDNLIPFPRYKKADFKPANEELANAAASGQMFTPCAIQAGAPSSLIKESEAASKLARCISFDTLVPGQTDGICCEWILPLTYGVKLPAPVAAYIYDDLTKLVVGQASVYPRGEECLIILNQHLLQPGSDPIRDPSQLRILLSKSGYAE